jgi:hypothetical protein
MTIAVPAQVFFTLFMSEPSVRRLAPSRRQVPVPVCRYSARAAADNRAPGRVSHPVRILRRHGAGDYRGPPCTSPCHLSSTGYLAEDGQRRTVLRLRRRDRFQATTVGACHEVW